jgi:hypothetical protein
LGGADTTPKILFWGLYPAPTEVFYDKLDFPDKHLLIFLQGCLGVIHLKMV